MNFKRKLSGRIHMNDIHEITFLAQGNGMIKRELYNLLFDKNDKLAYQTAWVFTHFSRYENEWLLDKRNELIDEVLICQHSGKRRLLLVLLLEQPMVSPLRTDFLDFCLERMLSKDELPGVQTPCMKLAYEMCRTIPELKQELCALLELMEPDLLQPSMRSIRKNVLRAMKTGRKL
jgi:hypothetical protein